MLCFVEKGTVLLCVPVELVLGDAGYALLVNMVLKEKICLVSPFEPLFVSQKSFIFVFFFMCLHRYLYTLDRSDTHKEEEVTFFTH